jgi:hypothetical protein
MPAKPFRLLWTQFGRTEDDFASDRLPCIVGAGPLLRGISKPHPSGVAPICASERPAASLHERAALASGSPVAQTVLLWAYFHTASTPLFKKRASVASAATKPLKFLPLSRTVTPSARRLPPSAPGRCDDFGPVCSPMQHKHGIPK